MRNILSIVSAITVITFSSCGGDGEQKTTDSLAAITARHDSLTGNIKSEENKLKNSTTFNSQDALGVLRLYTEFTTQFPNDTATPEYMFRAADVAQGTGNYQQAADFLETILSKYTTYEKYKDAMFSAALLYDSHLEDVNHGGDRAIQLYEQIEAKYPNSYYAEQSKVLKTYVGKPDSVFFNDVRRKADSLEALKK